MANRRAEENPNWQQRAREFAVGDRAFPYSGLMSEDAAGTVVSVFPAIGMVEVQFPHGIKRYPVEDLQLIKREEPNTVVQTPQVETIPAGSETAPVSGGPPVPVSEIIHDESPLLESRQAKANPKRVSLAFVKKALYWASKDRRYKATKPECDGQSYTCPKCRGNVLQGAIYKRRGGQSLRLLGCPGCLFLIKREDIMGDASFVEVDPATVDSMGVM